MGIWIFAAAAVAAAQPAPPAHDATWTAAREAIWAKELSIYAGRSRGDLGPYLAGIARGYMSWPPFRAVPESETGLQQTRREMAGKTGEQLEMVFLDMALHGDTAVIYYRTHRTRRADGSPADERFEVTHSWVREGGVWKVLGGMARATPADRPVPATPPR